MNIRVTPQPKPMFGARYKKEVVIDIKGSGGVLAGSSVLAGSAAFGPPGAWVVGALVSAYLTKIAKPSISITKEDVRDPSISEDTFRASKAALPFVSAATAKPVEKTEIAPPVKAAPTIEESQRDQTIETIQKALTSLNTEREKHRAQLTQIQEGSRKEEEELAEVTQQFKAVEKTVNELLKQLDTETELPKKMKLTQQAGKASTEYEALNAKVGTQTETVAKMKKNAETAEVLFKQIDAKLTEKQREYETMIGRLRQTEQYKQLAVMQQTLEALQRGTELPPELKTLKDELDNDFFTSQARADQVVTSQLADLECQTKVEGDILEGLRLKQAEMGNLNNSTKAGGS